MDGDTQIIRIVVDASGAKSGGDAAKGALSAIQQAAESATGAIGYLKEAVDALAGLALVQWFNNQLDAAKSAASAVENLSQSLGTTTDYVQALQYAYGKSGVGADSFSQQMNRLSATIGEAAEGNDKAVKTFNDIGVYTLDAAGKVRPFQDILTDVATALLKLPDASQRTSAAVQLFGKSGASLIPILQQIAAGSDNMATRAAAAGTVIDEETIQKLHALEVQAQTTKLKLDVLFANVITSAPVTDSIDFVVTALKGAGDIFAFEWKYWSQAASDALDAVEVGTIQVIGAMSGMNSAIGTALGGLPDLFKSIFANAMNGAIGVIESGINTVTGALGTFAQSHPNMAKTLGLDGIGSSPFTIGRISGGNAADGLGGKIADSYAQASAATTGPMLQALAAAKALNAQVQMDADEASARGGRKLGVVDAPGARNAAPASQTESLAKSLSKISADALIGNQGAQAQAQAATQGADAVAALEVHTKDLTEVTNAYIKSGAQAKLVYDAQTGAITSNIPAINAQVAALDKLNDSTRLYTNLKAFELGTNDLKAQNDDLALQVSLQGQTTEEIGRQVAQKQAYDLEQKQGLIDLANSNDSMAAWAQKQIADRTTAIDQQYQLKAAVDATAKAQALWLQPFSGAISSIQSSAESLFENILKGGTVTWQTLSDTIKSIFIKLFAELAVLAVVRPILAPIVDSVFTPGAAQQLGYGPTGSGVGALSTILTGGGAANTAGGQSYASAGGYSSGGNGLLGSFGSSINSFLNDPLFPSSEVPTGGYANVGDLLASGNTSASAAASGTISIGQGLGALAGVGSGIYQIATGHSTASTIGGIGSIVGAGVSLIPGLQPLGIGISLLSSILPGLFGGGVQIPAMPALNYSNGDFYSNGTGLYGSSGNALNGGASLASQAGSIGNSVLNLFTQAGLTVVPSQLIGGELSSGQEHTWNGQSWQALPYTQTGLNLPGGGFQQLTYDDYSRNAQQAADYLTAQVFQANVLNGGVSGASDTLKTALTNTNPTTTDQVSQIVAFVNSYDQLGKATDTVKDSIDQLNEKFETLSEQAQSYGVSLDPIVAEQTKETQRTAQDFIDSITDPLAVQMRQLTDSENDALASAQYIQDNISGVYVNIDQITQAFTQKQSDLINQYYNGAITDLQNVIQSLSYGTLSGASPYQTMMGAQDTYEATLAAAQGGSATAISALSGDATAFATDAESYYGNSQQYADLRAQIQASLTQEVGVLDVGGPAASGDDATAAANAVIASAAQTNATTTAMQQQINDLVVTVNNLTAMLQRVAVNML